MNFIKKIFDGKIDDSVHVKFQKFSKGEFKDRAVINVRKTKNAWKIGTTAEFANELVYVVAKKLTGKAKVKGAIISAKDLGIEYQGKKQFMGVKQFLIDKEMSKEEILDILEKHPHAFAALSFQAQDTILKIKAKAPKTAKPSSKGDAKPKADFCKLETQDVNIVKDFLFDINTDSKNVEISHDFIIQELVLPKNEKDFAKIRELAKRKGKIIRKINIEGKEQVKEKDFVI